MLRLVDSIEPGRLVSLKSGGPAMTVRAVTEDRVECVWFDAADVLQKASFLRGTIALSPREKVALRSVSTGTVCAN